MKRDYPQAPIVGVGIVCFRGGDVLLIRRGKPPRKGAWSLPGGRQKLGETVRDCALRAVGGLRSDGDVARQCQRLATARADLRRDLLELVRASRHQGHAHALGRQAQRQCPAYTAGGARDQGAPAM